MRVDIRRARWVHVAVLGLALNCATTEPPGDARIHGNFPSAETVDRLKSGPPPEVIFASDLRDVGDWEIAGPIPIAISADLIALGVLAGWDVSGVIKTGELAFGAVAETSDLSALLSAVLDEPLSRGALLAPGSSKIAVGDLLTESGGVPILAGLFGMYELFDSDSTAADAERVFDLLTAARAKRGVAEPHRLIEILDETVSAADDIGRGMHAQLALDDLAAAASARLRSAVLTWYFETSDLATIEFPSELLSARRLGAAIGVAHRKGPKDAWGHYVVMGVSRSY